MPHLTDLSTEQLLDSFSAPTPAPGGGAAAALAGAIGASLVVMVASLPRSRHGDPAERETLDAAAQAVGPARERLAALIDEDTSAYNSVMEAYRLPKGTEDETRQRQQAIQAGLRQATDVPLEVMRLCELVARQSVSVARHGNPSASSDLGVGLELLHAGCAGAALNVKVNLGQIRDGEYAARVATEIRKLDADLDRALAQAREALA